MNSRLLGVALFVIAIFAPAAAQASSELEAVAHASGSPKIPGLRMVWLAPWGDPAKAHPWQNIIVHQTETPAGTARLLAQKQTDDPTRRGVWRKSR